jgi:hypothetical protein
LTAADLRITSVFYRALEKRQCLFVAHSGPSCTIGAMSGTWLQADSARILAILV